VEELAERDVDDRAWRTKTRGSSAMGGRQLRRAFFSLSALGGYLIGISALAIALAARGRPVGIEDSLVLGVLAAGAVVAAIGGVILSEAYREFRNRTRR
jgi:hypothetical protein